MARPKVRQHIFSTLFFIKLMTFALGNSFSLGILEPEKDNLLVLTPPPDHQTNEVTNIKIYGRS